MRDAASRKCAFTRSSLPARRRDRTCGRGGRRSVQKALLFHRGHPSRDEAGTWCERFDLPLKETFYHSAYGPRLAALRREIIETGRLPQMKAKPSPISMAADKTAVPV